MTHLERLSETRQEQRAAPQPAQPEVVGVLPVVAGDTIPLPFDPQGLLARLDGNGNLAIRSGARTYILQNYIAADLREDVTILADDGSEIDLPLVIAATGPEVVFPTAAGFGGAPTGNGIGGNGIFEPFSDAEVEGPVAAAGVLDATEIAPGETPIPLRSSPEPDTSQEAAGGGAVPPRNSSPTAEDLALSAAEDGDPVDAAFSASDPDPADQGKLAFAILTLPAEGTLTDRGDGTFSYDPGAGFQALAEGETSTQSFTYQATDPQGAASNVAHVVITVTGVNDAPTASDKVFATTEDGPTVAGTLAGDDIDSDDDPGTLSFLLSALNGKGTLTDNTDGTFTFDPGTDFNSLNEGEEELVTFTYQTQDSHGALSAPATVVITVTGVNDAPTVAAIAANAQEDGPPVIVSAAGDDVDGDDDAASLTYVIVSELPRGHGAIADNGDGTFTFDPGNEFQDLAAGETTQVFFAYKAIDKHGATSDFALGTITVTGVNDAPTATDLAFTTSEDGPVLTQALAGDDIDSDDDATSLTYVVGGLSGKGTLIDHGDGTFSFDPGSDFDSLQSGKNEDVTFTYQAKDSHGALSAPTTVTITVTGVNDAPVASDVKADAEEDGGAVVGSYAATDVDASGTLAFTITEQPDEGTVTDKGNGTFSFDPGAGFQELAEERRRRSPSDTPRPTQTAPRRRKQSVSLRSPASTTILQPRISISSAQTTCPRSPVISRVTTSTATTIGRASPIRSSISRARERWSTTATEPSRSRRAWNTGISLMTRANPSPSPTRRPIRRARSRAKLRSLSLYSAPTPLPLPPTSR